MICYARLNWLWPGSGTPRMNWSSNTKDTTAAWIHAVLHKMEGDLANSRYWYRRADRMEHVADEPRAELAAIRDELPTD